MTVVRSVDVTLDYFDHVDPVKSAMLECLIHELLGEGVYRKAYSLKHDASVVLKVELHGKLFCNVAEFHIWQAVKGTEHAKWFAACEFIDHMGRCMVQERCEPMTAKVWERLMVPAYFNDLKMENWGIVKGQARCFDYALTDILTRGARGSAMQKANRYDG